MYELLPLSSCIDLKCHSLAINLSSRRSALIPNPSSAGLIRLVLPQTGDFPQSLFRHSPVLQNFQHIHSPFIHLYGHAPQCWFCRRWRGLAGDGRAVVRISCKISSAEGMKRMNLWLWVLHQALPVLRCRRWNECSRHTKYEEKLQQIDIMHNDEISNELSLLFLHIRSTRPQKNLRQTMRVQKRWGSWLYSRPRQHHLPLSASSGFQRVSTVDIRLVTKPKCSERPTHYFSYSIGCNWYLRNDSIMLMRAFTADFQCLNRRQKPLAQFKRDISRA